MRLFNLYRELSRTNNVVLLSSDDLGGEEVRLQHSEGFVERRIPKDHAFLNAWNELSAIKGEGDLSGPCVARAGLVPGALHLAYLEEYISADIIIHDSPFTVPYDLFMGADSKPRVYNSYNCETELYKKLHPETVSKPIHNLIYELETKILRNVDLVAYCGVDDLAKMQELAGQPLRDTMLVPNGAVIQPTVARPKRKGPITDAVFIGSGHLPNVEAARLVVEILAPAAPGICFHVIGGCLPEGRYPANVIRHGMIDNAAKDALMRRADVALNPMMSGSGSNLKVFDFFQNGLPVISTSFGMRGIEAEDGVHYIRAEIDRFADTLTRMTRSRREFELIGAAGRELAVKTYSWRAIAEPLDERLSRVQATRSGLVGASHILALNDYDPFDSVGGGATRSRALYQAVARQTPVVFLCLTDDKSLRLRMEDDGLAVLQVPKTQSHRDSAASYGRKFHVSVDDIIAYRHAPQNPYLMAIYDVLRSTARIVVTEHPYMVCLPYLRGDRFVYSSQNCESELKKDLLQWHPDREDLMDALFEAETIAVETSALTVAVSDEDAQALVRGRRQASPVIVVRNGAFSPVVASSEDHSRAKELVSAKSAVFLGSAHMPNVDAAKFIVAEIAPRLPKVEFHIVGAVCEALAAPLPSNVRCWGRVDNGLKTAVLEASTIALNPMLAGSGSNVKLADYLGHGLPVVTTEFGVRGYPDAITPHTWMVTAKNFASAVETALRDHTRLSESARNERRQIFDRHCSMLTLAEGFATGIADLDTPKKRVLFVTYRYTWPPLGGAESMMASFLAGLCTSGEFSVDVAAADVAMIEDYERFASRYIPVGEQGAMVGVPHLRYLRFPVTNEAGAQDAALRDAWRVQPLFERALYDEVKATITRSGLAWGWDYAERGGKERKAMYASGLHLDKAAVVTIAGWMLHGLTLRIERADGVVAFHETVSGEFKITFDGGPGAVSLEFAYAHGETIVKPWAAIITSILIDQEQLDLGAATVLSVAHLATDQCFQALATANENSRTKFNVNLTAIRGPHSPELEAFLAQNVGQYDLVITHNSIFRPAVAAVEAAHANGIKSILIPHAHLDDDYYHFPDQIDCARKATAVLAAPQAACRFLRQQGLANVTYLPAGVNTNEAYSQADVEAFRKVYDKATRFVLVLGRKSGAKNYQTTIDAVSRLSRKHQMHVVLIGPDDDGVPVTSEHATYLGAQPRQVIRGALQSCVALVNMSSSESFGIVLLEAWLAGRPVIANTNCPAFHDLAVHNRNALMVAGEELESAILKLFLNERLARRLAKNGRKTAAAFDSASLTTAFGDICRRLIKSDGKQGFEPVAGL